MARTQSTEAPRWIRRRRRPWIPGTIILPEARDWLNKHGHRVKPCTREGGQYRVIYPTGLTDVLTAEQVVDLAIKTGIACP